MKRFALGIYLFVAFTAGCASAVLATNAVVPQAQAAPATIQKWEYFCTAAGVRVTDVANHLGADGWEMAAAGGEATWCFKRPK